MSPGLDPCEISFEPSLSATLIPRCPSCGSANPRAVSRCEGCGAPAPHGRSITVEPVFTGGAIPFPARALLRAGRWLARLSMLMR